MDDLTLAHIHLMAVHIPVLGIPLGLMLLLYALQQRSQDLRRVALGVLTLTAIAAIPAYLTGESAEEVAEDAVGVSENAISAHEESAEITFVITEILGALTLLALILGSRLPKWEVWTNRGVLAGAVVASLLLARTANLGGRISHPEIFGQGNGSSESGDAKEHGEEKGESEGEDDDD